MEARALAERQRTLRRTIAWSYDLLTPTEQAVFRRLAVFSGGCPLEAIESLCLDLVDADVELLDVLASLVGKHLLQCPEDPSGDRRFVLLETIREHALEQLDVCGEAEAMRRRHACFFVDLAEAADELLRGPEQGIWMRRLTAEHDNMRAAAHWLLDRNDASLAARLAAGLRAWYRSTPPAEGRRWAETVLALPATASDPRARATALYTAGSLARFQGDLGAAQRLLEESIDRWQQLGDRRGLAYALLSLAQVLRFLDPAAAGPAAAECLRLFRTLADPFGLANALLAFGGTMQSLGRRALARAHHEESYAIFRALANTGMAGIVLYSLGSLACEEGEYLSGIQLCEESVSLLQKVGDQRNMAQALALLGEAARLRGDTVLAASSFRKALSLAMAVEDSRILAKCHAGLERLAASERRSPPGIGACVAPEDRHSAEAPQPFRARCCAGGLTPREGQVLQLLAGGRSNPRIAAELVLSVKTVERHLANIYAKIAVGNRVDAATYVLRHGLLR